MSKGTRVRLVENLTFRGSNENPRSFPREEKSTPPTYCSYITNFKSGNEQNKGEAKKVTTSCG
jgi:hypothetical protein